MIEAKDDAGHTALGSDPLCTVRSPLLPFNALPCRPNSVASVLSLSLPLHACVSPRCSYAFTGTPGSKKPLYSVGRPRGTPSSALTPFHLSSGRRGEGPVAPPHHSHLCSAMSPLLYCM